MALTIRKPWVAGRFYPDRPVRLRETIQGLTDMGAVRKKAVAIVSPHAGYVYSGPVAGAVFSSTVMPGAFVVLGPAHGEIGPLFAIQSEGGWRTPLGDSPIDRDLAVRILDGCSLVERDDQAHLWEHSLDRKSVV